MLGSNQVLSIYGNNIITGQAQSGLWFGKEDDLWSFGKPQGWGSVWRGASIGMGNVSDPFLMTGFDGKSVHFYCKGEECDCSDVFDIDSTGTAAHNDNSDVSLEGWIPYNDNNGLVGLDRDTPSHTFPPGFSAHWVRARVSTGQCSFATVTFHYT